MSRKCTPGRAGLCALSPLLKASKAAASLLSKHFHHWQLSGVDTISWISLAVRFYDNPLLGRCLWSYKGKLMHTLHCSMQFQLNHVNSEPAPADHMFIVAEGQSWLAA